MAVSWFHIFPHLLPRLEGESQMEMGMLRGQDGLMLKVITDTLGNYSFPATVIDNPQITCCKIRSHIFDFS